MFRLMLSSAAKTYVNQIRGPFVSFRPVFVNPTSLVQGSFCCHKDSWFSSEKNFDFYQVSEETLQSLEDKFEELLECHPGMTNSDVSLANGVLTVDIPETGIYVINKQTPNNQIWLSSPISGPAR